MKNPFKMFLGWWKKRKEERELEKKFQEKLKEIKKRDPYTYD